jgi:putative CocE/NonD family hydrolase
MPRARPIALVAALLAAAPLHTQPIRPPDAAPGDTGALRRAMPVLARAALARMPRGDDDATLNTTFRLQLVAGDDSGALATLDALRALRSRRDPRFAPAEYLQYEVHAHAVREAARTGTAYAPALRRAFLGREGTLDDDIAWRVAGSFRFFDLGASASQLDRTLATMRGRDTLALDEAIALVRTWLADRTYRALDPVIGPVLAEAEARRYAIDDSVRIPLRDGNVLSAVVVRPRRLAGPQPAVLEFTIYANDQNRLTALESAANGFVGIVATTRGKRASAGPVRPFEPDAADARDLLDWIARQPWSDGAVGMIGASYAGFTQWAAAKSLHPALRTIVPTVAVAPGVDFPREQGIVLNFQFAWARYVASGPLLDEAAFGDRARWQRLDSTWFARGTAYRDLDRLDGASNPAFRRWLDHPTYDAWWRAMIPQRDEYRRLAIPVLTITGYFDGAQPGALHYQRAHLAARPDADHVVLIGPWDHFGAQRRPSPFLGGERIDPVAVVDVTAVVYGWLSHVLRGTPRPALLADRVNFQVMGTDRWRHVPWLAAMATDTIALHLAPPRGAARDGRLVPRPAAGSTTLRVDLRDRSVASGTFIAPGRDTALDRANAVVFESEPLPAATTISGAFTGTLALVLDRRDADLSVTLYERTADGAYRQLGYSLGRASLARDPARRRLLVPGRRERLPITGVRITSRVVAAGSRLVAVVGVAKGPQAQFTYGSGKDPSDETIRDAGRPLRLELSATSVLRIPVLR